MANKTNRPKKRIKFLMTAMVSPFRLQRGSVLIMAIFFVVALMTVIPGTMLQMSRSNREIQRYVDQVPLSFAADGLQERAVKVLSDFVLKNGFPNAASTLYSDGYLVADSDSVITNGQDINLYLKNWYGPANCPASGGSAYFKCRVKDEALAPILNTINVLDVKVYQSDFHQDVQKRKYKIVTDFIRPSNSYKMQVVQEMVVNNVRLFDFSVFYNEDLEIGAGPDFTLQGPIFSNKNIYLINDYNRNIDPGTGKPYPGNTLSLIRSDDFCASCGSGSPERYVLGSAAHIYFGFNRAFAKNYLMSNPVYADNLKRSFAKSNSELASNSVPFPPPDDIEILPGWGKDFETTGGLFRYPPKYYYFTNGVQWYGGDPYNAADIVNTTYNVVRVENESGGFVALSHPTHGSRKITTWDWLDKINDFVVEKWYDNGLAAPGDVNQYGQRGIYTVPDQYGTASPYNYQMSLSTALDPANYPRLNPAWSAASPVTSSPPVNPLWTSLLGSTLTTVREDPSMHKDIPYGDPNHPHGPHVLIEPLTEIFYPGHPGSAFANGECTGNPPKVNGKPCLDSQEVKEEKLQWKAKMNGLNLYFDTAVGNVSNDLKHLFQVDPAILPGIAYSESCTGCCDDGHGHYTEHWDANKKLYDYRLGLTGTVLDIDVGKLLARLPSIKGGLFNNNSSGIVIYVHTYPMREGPFDSIKMPRFVRLINGNKLPEHGLTIASNGRVFVQGNYNTYIYPGKTVPPPAAIISDSIVVLSNEWTDNFHPKALSQRSVSSDVTVNAAIGTGFLPSQLAPMYTSGSSSIGSYDCVNNISSLECTPKVKYNFHGRPGSSLLQFKWYGTGYGTADVDGSGPEPPRDLGTYPQSTNCELDIGSVPNNCLYYKSADGFYFLNPNTAIFQAAKDKAAYSGVSFPDGVTTRVPLYASVPSVKTFKTTGNLDDLVAVKPMRGVEFSYLDPTLLWGWQQTSNNCPPCHGTTQMVACNPNDPDSLQCLADTGCIQVGGEGGWVCSGACQPAYYTSGCSSGGYLIAAPEFNYKNTYYMPLYNSYYSGGFENLINLQESFSGRTLNVLGAFSAPWKANELVVQNVPKYWGKSYYDAPARNFDFNEDLRNKQPPAVPLVFSIDRKKWISKGN